MPSSPADAHAAPVTSAGHTRRSHRKSRHGCSRCKVRRRKCDEIHPCCGSCRKLDVTCSFEDSTITTALLPSFDGPSDARSLTSSLESRGTQHPETSTCQLNLLDLRLYNNFIMTSIDTFAPALYSNGSLTPDAKGRLLFRVTGLVISKDYLLHSVLAVSALQLHYMESPSQSLVLRAAHLQNSALALSRQHMLSMSAEESIPMLFLASQTAMYGLAEGGIQQDNAETNPICKLTSCFQLVRGIKALIAPHWQFIKDSWAGPYLQYALSAGAEFGTDRNQRSHPQENILRSLALGLGQLEQRQSCLHAIDILFNSIHIRHRTKDVFTSARLIQDWAVSIDQCFESLLESGNPVSLVILAHFAVLLSMCEEIWWTRRWPMLLLHFVQAQLGNEYEELIAWPNDMISAYRTPGGVKDSY